MLRLDSLPCCFSSWGHKVLQIIYTLNITGLLSITLIFFMARSLFHETEFLNKYISTSFISLVSGLFPSTKALWIKAWTVTNPQTSIHGRYWSLFPAFGVPLSPMVQQCNFMRTGRRRGHEEATGIRRLTKITKFRKIPLNFAKTERELEYCQHNDSSLLCYVKLELNVYT